MEKKTITIAKHISKHTRRHTLSIFDVVRFKLRTGMVQVPPKDGLGGEFVLPKNVRTGGPAHGPGHTYTLKYHNMY